MNKKAFTLAEVLITLGIIGVVSAITIPTLIKNYQKKVTVEKLKVAYSLLTQAVNNSKQENGDIKDWDTSLSDTEFAEKYLLPYLKVTKVINTGATTKMYTTYTNGNYTYLFWSWNSKSRPIYELSNGMYLVFANWQQRELYLTIDINGSKGPNRLARDGFCFYLSTTKNQVLPVSFGATLEQLKGNVSYANKCVKDDQWEYYRGASCATLIMYNNWTIPDDYPW